LLRVNFGLQPKSRGANSDPEQSPLDIARRVKFILSAAAGGVEGLGTNGDLNESLA
jgi:hypothetical protein